MDAEHQLQQRRLAAAEGPTIATDSPGSIASVAPFSTCGSVSA
jgi:hypothetical protein